MWKDRGSAEWCSTEWRGKREKTEKREREEGGRRWRRRKERILEIKSSGERKSRRREEERELKVSVRTVWSSELDRDTAAVTSVLISPSAS